ncbi:type VI secretion system contractile sheath domain-containing protein [Burkholderia sp. LMG 32019]|uniref:type VI secretion system contractile sheath domain-containing protein n=1 Tax=Burkholderia sp. LMG 32019 TaxID=3158173 RepID=UPI003C2FB371
MSASFQNSTQRDQTTTTTSTSAQTQERVSTYVDSLLLDHDLAAIDRLLGRQIDSILHHPAFQALESAWRGLQFLVDRTDSSS